jgi:hypothetical protein
MPVRRSVEAIGFVLCGCLSLALLPSVTLSQVTTRSQNDPRPVVQAAPREGEVTIDGRIDESAWAAATPITELIQSVRTRESHPARRQRSGFSTMPARFISPPACSIPRAKGIRSALARRDQVMNGDNNLTSDRIARPRHLPGQEQPDLVRAQPGRCEGRSSER